MKAYILDEYDTKVFDCPAPTLADKHLRDSLAAGGDATPRMDVRFLAGGQMEVTTYSWVGVVRFSSVEIRVVPKLIGGNLRVLRMIEYAQDVRLIARLRTDRSLPAEGNDLFDLVVMLLAEETKKLIRDGLIRDYRSVEDSLDVMRGRLRIREQYLRRYGQLHRIECAFDEFDGDVPENQLLAAALPPPNRAFATSVSATMPAYSGASWPKCATRALATPTGIPEPSDTAAETPDIDRHTNWRRLSSRVWRSPTVSTNPPSTWPRSWWT